MEKAIKYKIVAWIVALFLIVLMPQGIYKQSQIQTTSIVSGIGIDKKDDKIEVSVQILVPQPSSSYAPKQLVSSATGENIAKAISAIELKVGQELGLAHCYIIILGDEYVKEDITSSLDYLLRSNIMGNNSAILHTDKTAKEVLETSSKLSEQDINNLQNIAKFNQEHYDSSNTNLINFMNDYLSPCPYSIMGTITLEEQQNKEQDASSTSESSKSPQKNSQESQKILSNKGEAIVLKNGIKIASLKREELSFFSWLDTKSQEGYINIKNYSDKNLENATITLKINHETAKFDPKLILQTPVLDIKISFECFVENITDENGKIISVRENILTENFKQKVTEKITNEINSALEISKHYQFDIIGAYTIFNNKFNAKWKNYLNTLENSDDYIKNLLANVSVSMQSKF